MNNQHVVKLMNAHGMCQRTNTGDLVGMYTLPQMSALLQQHRQEIGIEGTTESPPHDPVILQHMNELTNQRKLTENLQAAYDAMAESHNLALRDNEAMTTELQQLRVDLGTSHNDVERLAKGVRVMSEKIATLNIEAMVERERNESLTKARKTSDANAAKLRVEVEMLKADNATQHGVVGAMTVEIGALKHTNDTLTCFIQGAVNSASWTPKWLRMFCK